MRPGERRTVFEIEREKRWRIWLLFAALFALVCVGAWIACLVAAALVSVLVSATDAVTWLFTFLGVGVVFAAALVVSLIYWAVVRFGARGRLLKAMHCRPLTTGDRYHARLANIVEEMRLASGAPRIECVTVPTVGLNAFAFSDLHGAAVIGVTEGALARLSRQQLQAVVAHELAHVLSGDVVTATVSCMLFGIYSAIGGVVEEAVTAGTGADGAIPADVSVRLRGRLTFLGSISTLTTAPLSRDRERRADVAAARFTRDPLSLAEALRIISRHPGGAGYIPEGLSPLCIRTVGSGLWASSWHDDRPPLSERIAVLLALAHVPPDEFERQAEEACEHFDRREHWDTGPAVAEAATASGAAPAFAAAPAPVVSRRPQAPPVAAPGGMICPSCGAGLRPAPYEGLSVLACPACGGRLVASGQIAKLLARRDVAFSDEQRHLADLLAAEGNRRRRAAVLARGHPGVAPVRCPNCGTAMVRRHFSYEHAVEIDACDICDLTWFERDELEALQLLVEWQTG